MGMKILISDSLSKQGVELLEQAGFTVVVKSKMPKEELFKEIKDADGLIVRSGTKVTRRTDRGSRETESRRAGRVGPGQCRYAGSNASWDRRDEHAGRQYCDDCRTYDVDDLRHEPAYSPSHRVREGR